MYPRKDYGLIGDVKNDDLTQDDLQLYIGMIIDSQGLITHNIEHYNEFIDHGLSNILQHQFKISRLFPKMSIHGTEDSKWKSIRLNIDFFDISVGMPYYIEHSGDINQLYPNKARLTGISYSAPMHANANVRVTAIANDDTEDSFEVNIGEFSPCLIPIMTGSSHCHTSNLSKKALKSIGEDPNDVGGVFILKSQEFVIDPTESSKYNELTTHLQQDKSEIVRTDFISQPPNEMFSNSSQIKVIYQTNGLIVVEINSVKFMNSKIPFYMIYRLLGMTSSIDIVKTIVFNIDDKSEITNRIIQILDNAFGLTNENFSSLHYETDRESFLKGMAEKMVKDTTGVNLKNQKAKKPIEMYVNQDLLENMDNVFLPHMGKTANDRLRKLRFLGIIIRKTLLVHLGTMKPTDRDSYSNKRLHGPGISYPKLFKTMFNNMIISKLTNGYKKEFENNSWTQIRNNQNRIRDIFTGVLQTNDLTRLLEQSITSNNKLIMNRNRPVNNRVSAKLLERKNILNVYCALRSATTHGISNASKQTERADKIRRVHSSYVGIYDPTHSADSGEKVGLNRILAMTTNVTLAGNSLTLKERIKQDPDVILLDDITSEEMFQYNMSFLYINGELVGCCKRPYDLVKRYRMLRREGRIVDRFTTISWDERSNEVKFWLDAGRLTRPLLIVDNNQEEYDEALRNGKRIEFVQNIRMTKHHVMEIQRGNMTLDDFLELGLVEYISPEETENCRVAYCFKELQKHRNNVIEIFTHCDVEIAIMGLASLVSPFMNHTQTARITYETNQSKQTCGWFSFAYPFRVDKNRPLQYYNEVPLINTITNRFVPPNGVNIMIAYIANGSNQEDSADFSQASSDRGMFNVSYYKNERVELNQDEEFMTPDPLITKGMQPNANYKKLVNGVVPLGTLIEKGDILIGVVFKNNKQRGSKVEKDKTFEYTDRSLVYKSDEPAVVSLVVQDRGPSHEAFITVVLRYERPLAVGDKASCYTGDHDVLTTTGWVPIAEVTEQHEVATLREDGVLEYHHPTNTFVYDVDEPLYHIENPSIDLMVTSNHKMYVAKDDKFELIEAEDIAGQRCRYKKNCISNLNSLPDDNSRVILENLLDGDTHFTTSKSVADDMQRLSLHCGYASTITESSPGRFTVTVLRTDLEPEVNNGTAQIEKWVPYTGKVYCIEVPNHVFYVRRNGKTVWSGNSRSGNKSILAIMRPESDMPFNVMGLTPDLIANPHSIPSRMTVGQLLETSLSKVCARKGIIMDGTGFRDLNPDNIHKLLYDNGFRRNGMELMMNGISGERFDNEIFFGLIMEQRLQKFVRDNGYATSRQCPTDAKTGQPIGGKAHGGGLRIGEMEDLTLNTHGALMMTYEKWAMDSDGFKMYVCRKCGYQAVYNARERIYKCKKCKDYADISEIETTRSSVVFQAELQASGIDMRLGLAPREFEDSK